MLINFSDPGLQKLYQLDEYLLSIDQNTIPLITNYIIKEFANYDKIYVFQQLKYYAKIRPRLLQMYGDVYNNLLKNFSTIQFTENIEEYFPSGPNCFIEIKSKINDSVVSNVQNDNLSSLLENSEINDEFINDLIKISALFGSCSCFRYFVLNQPNFDNNLAKYAIAGGNTEIIEIFKNKIDDFSKYINVSLKYHQYDITNWIIDNYSVDIDYVYCLRHYCFKFLIENSQNNSNLISYDKNFLYHCAEVGIYDLVYLYVENNPISDNRESLNNETPLHAAARCNMVNICELLLSHGVDIDACDNDGWTPLMVAAYKNNLEVFQFLLQKGADIHHKDNYFESVYSIAAKNIQNYIVINGLLKIRR